MSRADDGNLDEAEIERLAHERELAAGYREAARRALVFARLYRVEDGGAGGARERACIAQAQVWRRAARHLKDGLPVPALPEGIRPGLAHARPGTPGADDGRKTG